MKPVCTVLATALVAVFLWVNATHAQSARNPLVFSKYAPEIAEKFGEKKPENVLLVIITKAPANMAYVVVVMKEGHRFKWSRGPYSAALKLIREVFEKIKKQKPASDDFSQTLKPDCCRRALHSKGGVDL